jgi:hypothetical protein
MRRDPRRHKSRRRRPQAPEAASTFPARWRARFRRAKVIVYAGLAVFAITALIVVTRGLFDGRNNQRTVDLRLPYLCERGYARARSAAETLAIDGMRSDPNPASLRYAAFVKTCGILREEARQRAPLRDTISRVKKR